MALKIRQKARYTGHEHWKWSVWLEGTASQLSGVRAVRYLLHHTFNPPTRLVESRRTHFRLDESGWGEFRIRADVIFKDGTQRRLIHDLKLDYPRNRKSKDAAGEKIRP